MSEVSLPFAVSIGQPGTLSPPWAQLIPVGQWRAISGTAPSSGFTSTSKLKDRDPDPGKTASYSGVSGQEAVTQSWNGGAYASLYGKYGTLLAHGGGHHNYFGSEVYGFDLESLLWSRLSEPNPALDGSTVTDGWGPPHGLQVNGSPQPSHTYTLLNYTPVQNSFWCFRTMEEESPSNVPQCGEFKLGENVWYKRQRATSGVATGGWSAYDSLRNKFVYRGGTSASASPRTHQLDPSTGAITLFNPGSPANISRTDTVGDYNPVDDTIVVLNGSDNSLYSTPAGSLGTASTLLNESGAPAKSAQAGFKWCGVLGGFIYYSQGANIYLVKKNVSNIWAWTNLLSGGAVVPEDCLENPVAVYGKFQVVEFPDDVALGLVWKRNANTGAVYAFRLN